MNLHTQNCQNVWMYMVERPPMNPNKLETMTAGILPYLSPSQPNIKPPRMEPLKNILCARVTLYASSQTCVKILRYVALLSQFVRILLHIECHRVFNTHPNSAATDIYGTSKGLVLKCHSWHFFIGHFGSGSFASIAVFTGTSYIQHREYGKSWPSYATKFELGIMYSLNSSEVKPSTAGISHQNSTGTTIRNNCVK